VYSGSISGIKGGTIVQAENDGKVQFTGSFNPGNAGFEMRGIVVKSSDQKELGSGQHIPAHVVRGRAVVRQHRQLADGLQYQDLRFGILWPRRQIPAAGLRAETAASSWQNAIFRPDGGWGQGCSESEPHAAYNMYDTEGFSITGAIVVDAISDADGASENIGGQVVNTHQQHGNVGTITQSSSRRAESTDVSPAMAWARTA
jgi:hypothetical protein